MKKRLLSLALVLCMVLTLLPVSAFADDNLLVQSGADIYLECGTATQKLFYITGFGYDGSNIQFRCSTTYNPPIKLLPASGNYRQFGYNYIYGNFDVVGLHPGNCVIEAYNIITGENVAIFFVHVTEQTIKINSCAGNEMSFSCYSFNSNANLDIGYSQIGVYHGTGLNVVSKTIDSGWLDQSDPYNREKDVYRYRYDCKLTIYSTGDFNGYIYDTNDSSSVITIISFTINDHRFDNVERIAAPTCTQQGYTVFRCSACDAVGYGNYTSALGHNYSNWILTTTPTCTMSGEETRYCSRCNAYETRTVDALSHNYTAVVTAPTCTEKGYTTHSCACGASYVDSYVDAFGHDFGEWQVTTAATCNDKGVETRYCSRCDETQTREIKALGHDLVHHDGKAASCTEKGWEVYDTCSRCDYTTYKEIPATGHNYTAVVTAPTCTEKGYTTYTCACGDSYVADYKDALGHDFGEWQVTTAPTCTEKGVETHSCSRCDATETREVAALGHDLAHHDGKTATCTENGWKAYDTCSRCDYTTYKEIPATGHSYTAVVTDPSCTEKGYTTHTCACGDTYVDTYVDALGHDYKKGKCTRCGAKDPTPIENPFTDVKSGQYYYEPVLWAVQNDITKGTSATTFSPNATCTRGQTVTFLWRAMGSPEVSGVKNPFVDVKPSDYYYKAVLWAVKNGITQGIDATHFGPNKTVTRGQTVTFLWRAAGQETVSGENIFSDVNPSDYYYNAVLWAVKNGITNGMTATTFSPNSGCTRGQIVTFLYRHIEK